MLLQTSVVFAASPVPPSADFFENAWQEATASQAYSFTCTISSSGVKAAKGATLTSDQKKQVDVAVKALKKYKKITVGAFLGQEQKLYTTQTILNSLGILDAWAADKLTIDEAAQKMRTIKKGKLEILIAENSIYYKGKSGWKVFEDAEFATPLYGSVSSEPLTASLEKASFMFKKYMNSEKSSLSVYQGTITAKETASLVTPFVGEDAAKQQVPSPTTLTISADGHLKKYDVIAKIVLGGLSFTVKEQCNIKPKEAKINLPSGAAVINSESGKKELGELVEAL